MGRHASSGSTGVGSGRHRVRRNRRSLSALLSPLHFLWSAPSEMEEREWASVGKGNRRVRVPGGHLPDERVGIPDVAN